MNTIQPWNKKMNQDMIKLHFEETEYIESYDKLARENTLSKGFEEIEEGLRDEKYDTQLKHQKGYWQIICSGSLTPGTYPSDDTIAGMLTSWAIMLCRSPRFSCRGCFPGHSRILITGTIWLHIIASSWLVLFCDWSEDGSLNNKKGNKKAMSTCPLANIILVIPPVLYPIIRELNLLSSDIGRMALSTAVIGDVVGIYGVITFEAAKQGEGRPLAPIGYILSLIVVLITIFGGNRMLMFQIIKKTPEGKPVEQFYIVTILAGVLAWGSVAGSDMVQNNVKSLNFTVLDHAPCSVAVLVDKGNFKPPINSRMSVANMQYHFAMLFLGGADAREALACADRMAGNPNVSLTVIRFLAHNGEGENEMEKKLDDGLVTAFWVKYEANEQVAYREVVVRNGEETVAAIRAMNSDYDLWIVGRKLGINPILIEGLSSWSESLELGVIGDYVASVDFRSSASVLVVQQQVLRDRETNSGGMQGRISRYFNKLL
ncbi:cation/H(+) antiporter 24 [Tanacetum coccineum]